MPQSASSTCESSLRANGPVDIILNSRQQQLAAAEEMEMPQGFLTAIPLWIDLLARIFNSTNFLQYGKRRNYSIMPLTWWS